MNTTETTTAAERAGQIRARLAELGPYPRSIEDVTAASLARYLAVRAQVLNRQILSPDGELTRHNVDLVTILFAAAHALFALHGEEHGIRTAEEIWNAWEDGSGVGEWLWDHLGDEKADEAGVLAEEMLALRPPGEGLMAHSGTIRRALEFAAVNAPDAARQESYFAALVALDAEESSP